MTIRISHIAIAHMFGALMSGQPQSVEDLVHASGLCDTTVRHYIKTFRRMKVIRIARWTVGKNGRLNLAMYAPGSGKDAARAVTPIDNAARMRKLRDRQRGQRLLMRLAA